VFVLRENIKKNKKNSKKVRKMTRKQAAFCCEYVIDYNATKAAIRAGFSKNGAGQTAERLLKKVEILQYIDELEAEKQAKRDVTIDKILAEYAKIAFTDLPGIINYSRGIMSLSDFEKLTPDQRACIKKFKIKTGNPLANDPDKVPCDYVEIELHDKMHALDMMGKHLGMFVERHSLDMEKTPELNLLIGNKK